MLWCKSIFVGTSPFAARWICMFSRSTYIFSRRTCTVSHSASCNEVVGGGGGGREGYKRICSCSLARCPKPGCQAFAQMLASDDFRLALSLVLLLRFAGVSHLLRHHRVLTPFLAMCAWNLDSLFDLLTQSRDPFFSSRFL